MENTTMVERDSPLQPLIEKITSENTKHYINSRILPQMKYYSTASRKCKKQYRRWMVASIIFAALVPVVSVFADGSVITKIIIAALGSAVTAINAYLALENSKDLWCTYRYSRETLLSTLYCYLNNAGVFAQMDMQEAKDSLLIEICEKEMMKETGNWITTIKS